jgi:hypothetical protein
MVLTALAESFLDPFVYALCIFFGVVMHLFILLSFQVSPADVALDMISKCIPLINGSNGDLIH